MRLVLRDSIGDELLEVFDKIFVRFKQYVTRGTCFKPHLGSLQCPPPRAIMTA